MNVVVTTGELEVYRDESFLGFTTGLNLVADTWYYMQFKVKCHQTLGEYELKVGNVTVLSDTGIDTDPASAGYNNKILFGKLGWGGNYPMYIDDLSILDSTGSINNDFLGISKIVVMRPDGDDTANWGTVSPGPNHYEAVNEVTADGDTSYVEEGTVNVTDLYDYGSVPAIGDIWGIQVNTNCRESDATSFSLVTPVESNSVQYDDAAQPVKAIDYTTISRILETDPDTGNYWVMGNLNTTKFGVKIG